MYRKELIVMSMLYPAMNKLTQYIPNRYMMVNAVSYTHLTLPTTERV